ncbi:MAG TPA: hypothetical protein DIV51_04785 [Lachnospiraceae bacterium]|nr:hypothetical protein [Lachnospiraceae bacterium]
MLWEPEDRAEQCRILQIGTIDTGNRMLFGAGNKREIQRDHLTLVIGSGGMGAAAIRAAVRKARQNLVSDFDNYTKFIMVDSDQREMDRMEKEQIKTLNIFTPPGAAERLRLENRTDFFKRFVPHDYDVIKLSGRSSPACDRMTGKIEFYDEAMGGTTNDVKFRNIIGEIFNTDWSNRSNLPVDIMIVAGLSGGTGSGTFEELAAHAREACIYSGAIYVRVYGYLFLPDTMEKFEEGDPDRLNTLYANGYAALKELESYMSIPASPGRTEKFYSGDGMTTMKCNSDTPLFDCPVLISGTYEESIRMMADLIVNLSTSGTASLDSFYRSIPWTRSLYLNGNNLTTGGVLKNNVFPEDSRRYCGIGYAYAAIPKEIVTANIVGNVCQKFYQTDETGRHFCTEENRMSRAEMEIQIRRLFGFGTDDELNEMSLWNLQLRGALERCSRLPDNPVDITPHEVLAGNISAHMRGFQASARVVEGTWELRSYLVDQVRLFKENARQVIRDYGPKAMELLYKGMGPYNQDGMSEVYPELSIENMLNTAREELQKVRSKTIARPEFRPQLLEIITHAGLTQWRADFQSAIQHEVKQKIIEKILEPDGAWEKQLINPIKNFINQCKRFADSLETLSNFYKSAGSSLDAQSYEQFRDASQTGNCVNLCNNANVYGWVKENIQRKINAIHLNDVKQNIVNSFIENTVDWVSDVEGKTRKVFDEVMARSCELGSGAGGTTAITLTATSYFDYVLEQEPQENVANKARELAQGIVRQLIEKSKPTFKTVPGAWSVIDGFLFLPAELEYSKFATPIKQAFRDEFAKIWGFTDSCIFANVSDVICYQTSKANALCDLQDIGKWEDFYNSSYYTISRHSCNGEYVTKFTERTKSEMEEYKSRREGRTVPELRLTIQEEILFGTGLSWEHYPPVALRNLESNEKEKEFLRTMFNPIVDYAMEEKLIERKINQMGNRDIYEYVVHLIPDDWNNLGVENYENIGLDGKFLKGKELFDYLKQQNKCSTKLNQKSITLSDSGIFAGPFDFSNARQCGMSSDEIEKQSIVYMKRILRKNTELFLELRETLCRYYEIEKALEKREKEPKIREKEPKTLKIREKELKEWVCSYGHHNPEDHCFCSICGEKRGWKCESCGHYNNNKIRFCSECGARAPMK